MTRGKWVLAAILFIAVAMGLATWPLLKVRRKREVQGTTALIGQLKTACESYRLKHGSYPEHLSQVSPLGREPVDAWGRPFQYEPSRQKPEIRSLGPSAADPADDIAAALN